MIMEKILSPSDVKNLDKSELPLLAKEVRKRIVSVTSKIGGHIAPSLGTVDFTIALLRVFDPLIDRIVWDVGHQAYAWKILTGRQNRFETIRSYGGLSGFTNRSESEYDAFGTGHSSTSISAALGIACGRDHLGESGYSVAIIGDGALTGGMSFEALNHAGHLQKDRLIVILNDNAMSISKNVGGLQKYMSHMLSSKSYNKIKGQIWNLVHGLPERLRNKFIHGAQKLEESLMNILVPHIIFEDLGFKYLGPIDGHNIEQVIEILTRAKENMVGPVLIHLVTRKGKGYQPAEKDASLFHGIGPFESKSGQPICTSKESWSEVMGKCLCRMAITNPRIIAITAAMAAGTGLSPFEELFPQRFYDVGIAEQHAVTFAAGLAVKGLKPFVAVYSTFLQRSLDQIIHDVALQRLPVVFCVDRAGLVGEDGATHHGAFDISFLSYIPDLVILAPSSAEQLDAMLMWAAQYSERPVVIRYPRGIAFCEGKTYGGFVPGKALIAHKGDKIALIGCGDAMHLAKEVHQLLTESGVDPWLIDLQSIKPLDEEILIRVAKTCSHIFTLETNVLRGGVGSSIRDLLNPHPSKIWSFGYPDRFIPHGSIAQLNKAIGLTADQITPQIIAMINQKTAPKRK